MATKEYKLVECKAYSDVVCFRTRVVDGETQIEVQDDPHETNTLITARMLASQAIRLARALLDAYDCGEKNGNVTRYTFVD